MHRHLFPVSALSVVSLLLVAFAVAQLYSASQLPLLEDYTLGPGALPILYSIGLLLFSAYLLFDSAVKVSPRRIQSESDYRSGMLCILFLLIFVSSIYVVGFMISTIAFCFLFCQFISKIGLAKSIAFSLIWGGGNYLVANYLLMVPLEAGFLFS